MNYERLTSENAALLMVDHQTGLANGVQTQTPPVFINNVKALATLGKNYKLPTIITTSFATGPNGPIMPIVEQTLPNATIVHRPGEINAWDNPDFVKAVEKIGRKKLLIVGISTEVCVALVSLSAVNAGYEVYAVLDASGTWDKLVEDAAIARMVQAGIIPITWCAVGAELLGDWRSPPARRMGRLWQNICHSRATTTLVSSLPKPAAKPANFSTSGHAPDSSKKSLCNPYSERLSVVKQLRY
ncbi:isochorismatase family protein [Polaromonas sp. P1(28)-8]|nr:isochorismatase family protein [Polaromonas sp. P1(28)-8]